MSDDRLFSLEQCPEPVERKGHADYPGTGPEGCTCRTCVHYTRALIPSGRVFRKCGLMRRIWTHGPGTDIRAKDPACKHWEQRPEHWR